MNKKFLTFGVLIILIAIIIVVAILFVYFPKDDSSSERQRGVWSGIEIELELTQGNVSKKIVSDANFVFSEEPLLLVQSYQVNKKWDSASFIVRTQKEQEVYVYVNSEPFTINEGESYFYEPEQLNITLISLGSSNICGDGFQC